MPAMRTAADLRAHGVARFRAEHGRLDMSTLPEDRAPACDGDEALTNDPRGGTRFDQGKGEIGRFSWCDFEPARTCDATNERGKRRGVMVMSDRQQNAAELRRYATLCVKIAQRMSLRDNQDRMMEMAQHFQQLAQKEDAKAE